MSTIKTFLKSQERIIQKYLYVSFFAVALGFMLQVAHAWVEPTVAPTGANAPAPINESNVGQEKIGGLLLNTGGARSGLIVDKGSVGIGTINPLEKLHIVGSILAEGTGGLGRIVLKSTAQEGRQYEIYPDGTGVGTIGLFDRAMNKYVTVVDKNGNVGIGTTSPQKNLDVNGSLRTGYNLYGSQGSIGFFTDSNAALPVKVGSLTVSDTYGDNAPINGLFVKGKVQIKDGTQGAGRVFVSDASGIASWQAGVTGPQGPAGASGMTYVGSCSSGNFGPYSQPTCQVPGATVLLLQGMQYSGNSYAFPSCEVQVWSPSPGFHPWNGIYGVSSYTKCDWVGFK
ncbi:MAG: hypothetical protein HZA36_02420 [Parcubacteria group bacterium]|nr:hypothetical protein [Parcubacteria group bacterium]